MNDVLKILYIMCFVLASVSFCTSVFIFFKFRIIEVIKDLNGTIAKRQIELMRERNENAKNYGAGLLDTEFEKTDNTGRAGGTVLKPGAAIAKSSLRNQTNAVGSVQNDTTVLQSNRKINSDFIIIKNIVFVNTSECI